MKKTLYKYYLIIFLFILPIFAVYPITTIYAKELGASIFQISLMNALFSVLPLILAIPIGKLIDKAGEKILLLIGSIGLFIALMIPFLYESFYLLCLMKFLLGGFQLLGILTTQNGVQMVSLPENRTKVIANFSLFSSVGILLGPLLGTYLVSAVGYQKTYLFLALLGLIAFGISSTLPKIDVIKIVEKEESIFLEIKGLLQRPGLLTILIISMFSLSTLDIFYIYFPLYASGIGLSLAEIGWVLSIQGFSNAIARFFLDKFIKKVGYINLLVLSLLLGGLAFTGLILFDSLYIIMLMAAIIGVGLGIIQPLTTTLTFQFANSGHTAMALGLRLMGNRLGQIILPIVFSGFNSIIGLAGIFVIATSLLVVGGIIGKVKIKSV